MQSLKINGQQRNTNRSYARIKISQIKIDGGLIDFYLPLLGILQYYSTGGTGSYGSLILYLYTAIELVFSIGRRPLYFHKGLVAFTIYALLVQPIVFSQYGGFSTARLYNFIAVIYIVLILAVFAESMNIDRFFRVYLAIGLISSAVIAIQSVQLYAFHQNVYGIALLPCDTSGWYSGGNRPCGLFPEPSVYAYYVLPLIVLCLQNGKKRIALLITLCVFMSTSSMGIISAAFVWAYWFLRGIDIRRILAGCAVMVVLLLVTMQTPMGHFAVEKIMNIDLINSPRITRGFLIFANLDPAQQLFGIGRNNLEYFIDNGLVQLTDWASTQVSEANLDYVTSASGIMINYGLLGVMLYFIPLGFMLRVDGRAKILLALFIILSFVQTMFFDMNFVFLLLIIINLEDKEKGFWKIGSGKVMRSQEA